MKNIVLILLMTSFGGYSQVGLHNTDVTIHGVDLYLGKLEIDSYSNLRIDNNSCVTTKVLQSKSVIYGDNSSTIFYRKAIFEVKLDGVRRSYYRCSDAKVFKVFNYIGQYLLAAEDLKKVYNLLPKNQMLLIVYSSGITRKIIISNDK